MKLSHDAFSHNLKHPLLIFSLIIVVLTKDSQKTLPQKITAKLLKSPGIRFYCFQKQTNAIINLTYHTASCMYAVIGSLQITSEYFWSTAAHLTVHCIKGFIPPKIYSIRPESDR